MNEILILKKILDNDFQVFRNECVKDGFMYETSIHNYLKTWEDTIVKSLNTDKFYSFCVHNDKLLEDSIVEVEKKERIEYDYVPVIR